MLSNLLLKCMIVLLILEIINPQEVEAEHKNSLINKFCIATLKSKLRLKDKDMIEEVSHYSCECFSREYKSGGSIKDARYYCKNKTAEKFNL